MKISRKSLEKIPIDMTPMIDVVFQLMAFFIMTFSVVAAEGDFNVKMPLGVGPAPDFPIENIPVAVRLEADERGELLRLKLGDRDLGRDFALLRAEIQSLSPMDGPDGSTIRVEIDSDYGLDYRYTVDALTAVTGYRNRDGQIIKLLDQVRFAAPRKPAM